MTSQNPEPLVQGPPEEQSPETVGGAVRPGIYLEEKKSSIGTGGTARMTEYRTFWVTLSIDEKSAVMVLLDDDFKPTAIRETFSREIILGDGWHFIAEGEKRYQRLRPHLDRLLAPPRTPAAPQAAPAKGGGNWWDGGGEVKDPFALDRKSKARPVPKKGGWWDK
ncbi:MAG: hypothetical protein LBP33_09310 [Candidatus Adiutrix sp.]|nr:hypothetical protein [Candidatus Adiutrix sp.]